MSREWSVEGGCGTEVKDEKTAFYICFYFWAITVPGAKLSID